MAAFYDMIMHDECLPDTAPVEVRAFEFLHRYQFFYGLPDTLSFDEKLAAGVKFRSGWEKKTTPMFVACYHNAFWLVRWLYEYGETDTVRTPNEQGRTPFYVAVRTGNLDMCKWLFDHGAAEDVRRRTDAGSTPLLCACHRGHAHVAKWLYENGAKEDLNVMNSTGWAPLSIACWDRKPECIKWVLRVGGAALVECSAHATLSPLHQDFLEGWIPQQLALHDDMLPLVLWGMMSQRSGTRHLWMMSFAGDLPRQLVMKFVGVELNVTVLTNLREAWAILQEPMERPY